MSVLDTLEICFQANLDGVDAQLTALSGQLNAIGAASLKADAGLRIAGQGLSDGLVQAIQNSDSSLRQSGSNAARAYAQGVRAEIPGAVNAGRALADGFARGISARSAAVNAAIRRMAGSATQLLRTLLSIHSPSKVTQEYGAFFAEGFAGGIRGAQIDVERAAGSLGNTAANALRRTEIPVSATKADANAAAERALENVNLTIPIHVDGMKLGEASIRGINAVTRSAGRLMLNL